MINTKLQSIIDTKSAIGNAITNKGGTITTNTPFFNYAAQIDGISTGTPQTIFAASDGSKWALTNLVNLTNVSNNVTHDFNRWQPANNSTSAPILNVGTVTGNQSGNIRIVQVNQVNIAQYGNIVINDTTSAKYVGYNGYDFNTNNTPTGNTTFNRWLLNNSATGTVLFANTVISVGGIYNGPNTINTALILDSEVNFGSEIFGLALNNGFIYAGGGARAFTNRGISKYHQSNLVLVGNTVNFGTGQTITEIRTNNSFIFASGHLQRVRKYGEANLSNVGDTNLYGGIIFSMTLNDGFIYAGGEVGQTYTNGNVKKYHQSNLVFVNNSVDYNGVIYSLVTNNGYVYAGGGYGTSNNTVAKYHESNLAFVGNTSNYGASIESIAINNGFIYVGGGLQTGVNRGVSKFYESNLALVSNTPNYGGIIYEVATNNGFLYVGGATNQRVQKYYESNLAFHTQTDSLGHQIDVLKFNNGFMFLGGSNNNLKKYNDAGTSQESLFFYTATKIKE